jgi:hypothetical protein
MTYEIGDGVRLSVTFSNAINGTLVNPSVVGLILRLPDGTQSALAVNNPSAGNYYTDYITTQPGVHWFRWAGSGSYDSASEGNFVVSRSQFNV